MRNNPNFCLSWKKSQYISNNSFSKASLIQHLHSLFTNQTFPYQHIMMNQKAPLTIHDSWSTWAHLQEQPSTLSSVLLQSRVLYRRIHWTRRLVSACALNTFPHYLQIHCAVRLTERWIIVQGSYSGRLKTSFIYISSNLYVVLVTKENHNK